jgi:ribosomal protein S18 acetylase RimI-like enzyme
VLQFVTAKEASIEAFLSVSAQSPFQPQLRDYADSLLRQRNTRPDWCVLGLDSEVPVARAALWALSDEARPSDVVLIDADWSEPDLARGQELLSRVHGLATELGAHELHHHVDVPPGAPQFQENDSERSRLLIEAGYELLRDGLRWQYTPSPDRDPPPEFDLAFRNLREVGEDAFVAALAATLEGTLDSWLTRNIEDHGLLEAARADFRDYQQMDHLPEWWELAYLPDGELAGVIMGARNPSAAVVAYVGVVPRQRGHGFAVQLVRRGTEQLLASGADEIRGDCDRDNTAMVKAFRRAGYEQIARRRTYRRDLGA